MLKENEQNHCTMTLPSKQLRMVIDDVSVGRLPDVPMPAGYVMRAHRTGDAESWADALRKGGIHRLD